MVSDDEDSSSIGWVFPKNNHKLKRKKSFTTLQRISDPSLNGSPTKKTKFATSFTDNESNLMDKLGFKPILENSITKESFFLDAYEAASFRETSSTPLPSLANNLSPVKSIGFRSFKCIGDTMFSPLKSVSITMETFKPSPPRINSNKTSRRTTFTSSIFVPPSFSPKDRAVTRKPRLSQIPEPDEGGPSWTKALCLDWSLKSGLTVISSHSFGWSSSNLQSSEESSGISSFVRCIDIAKSEPSKMTSQIDSSIGAQFRNCCLYWQHPTFPGVNLFPREPIQRGTQNNNTTNQKTARPNVRLEKNTIEALNLEWIESFKSIFHLLKACQCPFFYVCMNNFTCLFCAEGIQNEDSLQIYITPASKSFIRSLTSEGIKFSLPYASAKKKKPVNEFGSDDEQEEELNGRGYENTSNNGLSLVYISGSDVKSFVNFIVTSKSLLTSITGPFAGIPPTILSPVAFQGAVLKNLSVTQKTYTSDSVELHSIELKGPILPSTLHLFTSLLHKTVKNFKMRLKTLETTIPLNVFSTLNRNQSTVKSKEFYLQNLSDSGLRRCLLEMFCNGDNCDTIQQMLEGRRNMYRWY